MFIIFYKFRWEREIFHSFEMLIKISAKTKFVRRHIRFLFALKATKYGANFPKEP